MRKLFSVLCCLIFLSGQITFLPQVSAEEVLESSTSIFAETTDDPNTKGKPAGSSEERDVILDPALLGSLESKGQVTKEKGESVLIAPLEDAFQENTDTSSLSSESLSASSSSSSSDPMDAVSNAPLPDVNTDPLKNIAGVQGEYSVSEFTGDVQYSYPLFMPPGRNGSSPSVTLSYSASNKEGNSELGTGWNLDLPKIERYSRTGVENLYANNNFLSPFAGGNGELSIDSIDANGHGTYIPKIQTGAVYHEFKADNTWEITDAAGVVYRFGTVSDAREQSDDGGRMYTWYLTEIEDTNGNKMIYEYTKSQGSVYLKRILYGNEAQPYEVRFEPYFSGTLEQFDVLPSYSRLFPVVEQKDLLDSVEVFDPFSGDKIVYELTYDTQGTFGSSESLSGTTDYLISIQQKGVAASGVETSLPPTEFEYESYDGSRSFDIVYPDLSDENGYDNTYFDGTEDSPVPMWIFADETGDGWEDLVSNVVRYKKINGSYHHLPYERLFVSQGNGEWVEDPDFMASESYWAWEYRPHDIRDYFPPGYRDNNGDVTDHLCIRKYHGNLGQKDGLSCYNGEHGNEMKVYPRDEDFQFLELNADGHPDGFKYDHKQNYHNNTDNSLYRNTGTAFEPETSAQWNIPDDIFYDEGSTLFGDINGDGLDDMVHWFQKVDESSVLVEETKRAYLNTGEGWQDITADISLPVPIRHRKCQNGVSTCEVISVKKTFTFLDANRDGLVDLFHQGKVHLNNGYGWESTVSELYNSSYDFDPSFPTLSSFTDLNKDGAFERKKPVGKTFANNNEIVDLPVLTNVTSPQGGFAEFEYTPASSYTNADGSAANIELPIPRLTLSKLTTDDGMGNTSETNYEYAGGKMYRNHVSEQELLGFHMVTKALPDNSKIITEYEQGSASQNFAGKGSLTNQKIYTSSGDLLQETQNFYDIEPRGTNSYESLLETSINLTYSEHNPSNYKATASEYTYDQYGNIIQAIDYGEVNVVDTAGNFTDIGSDTLTSNIEYAENAADHILSLPQRQELLDNSGTVIGESKIYYDNLPLGQVSIGNRTKTETLACTGQACLTPTVTTLTEYNSYGLPTKVTNPRGYDTNITYDSQNLFPETITNAKLQITNYEYDYLFGIPVEVTDPNGAKSITVLDSLGRVTEIKVTDPNNTDTEIIASTINYDTTSVPNSVTTTTYTHTPPLFRKEGLGEISVEGVMYLDGFGRLIQSRTEAEGSAQYTVHSIQYDDRGNMDKQTLPVFQSGISYTASSGSEVGSTYTYDALSRVLSEITPVGTTSTAYDQWSQTVTDANGHPKDFTSDARGNLTEVTEHLDGTPYDTNYAYDQLNNLITITDAKGNIRNFTYDLLGRRISMEDLHTANDATFGLWTFDYDDNSNLITQTDPKDQEISYTYDELDRVLTESAKIPPSSVFELHTSYAYDTGTYGIGRLSSIVSPAVTKNYTYDILGRVINEQKKILVRIDGNQSLQTFDSYFTYDLAGNQLSITYPGSTGSPQANMLVEYTYNNAGLLEAVQKDGADIVTNLDYIPVGLVEKIDYANGVSTTNTYDIGQIYRLTNKSTLLHQGSGGQAVHQDISYTFDPVGNITQITDTSETNAAKTSTFTYDDLDRLLSATVSNAANGDNYARNYTYDIIGNMLSHSEAGSYEYAGGDSGTSSGANSNPHAVTDVAGVAYSYDDNGNLISNNTWTHGWDYKDRLLSSTDGTATVNYTYDEGGARVKKVNATSGKETVYVNEFVDIEDSAVKNHIYAGGMKVATYSAGIASGSGSTCTVDLSTCTGEGARSPLWENETSLNGAITEAHYLETYGQMCVVILSGGEQVAWPVAQEASWWCGEVSIPVYESDIVYHHEDHLTGSNVDTDDTGNLIQLLDYYPYGDTRLDEQSSSYANDYKFTGKEKDEDTGLYYYEARYYDSGIGRFISLDPWFGDIYDPQSLNKYAYVRNNPLKYVDETGEVYQKIVDWALKWAAKKTLRKEIEEMIFPEQTAGEPDPRIPESSYSQVQTIFNSNGLQANSVRRFYDDVIISGISENNQNFTVNVGPESISLYISFEDSTISSAVTIDLTSSFPTSVMEKIDDEGSVARLELVVRSKLENHYKSIKPKEDGKDEESETDNDSGD